MYRYTAYGLGISSALQLPELDAGEASTDLVIRFGSLKHAAPETDSLEYSDWKNDCGMYLFWKNVCTILIKGGKEIIIDAATGAEAPHLRLLILGAAMGVVLHQRGLPVFHASAIEIDGKAVAFLGGKMWGKSTMAAALHARGHRVIADDVMALSSSGLNGPVVLPAFPQLKLWPDSVASLGEDPEALPRISPSFVKRDRPISNGFARQPTPLQRIYVLGKGPSPQIDFLRPSKAFFELIRNYYSLRFDRQSQISSEGDDFFQCAKIANCVPVFLLTRPPDLGLLPDLARQVEEHLAS